MSVTDKESVASDTDLRELELIHTNDIDIEYEGSQEQFKQSDIKNDLNNLHIMPEEKEILFNKENKNNHSLLDVLSQQVKI